MISSRKPRITVLAALLAAFGLQGCLQVSMEESASRSMQTGNPPGTTDKSIYSAWDGGTDGPSLNLQAYRAPAMQKIRFELDDGAVCECVTGSSAGGSALQVSQCANATGTTGEHGCSTFTEQYSLIQNGGVLDVCDSKGDCSQFR